MIKQFVEKIFSKVPRNISRNNIVGVITLIAAIVMLSYFVQKYRNITENFETPESGTLQYSDGSVRRFVFVDQDEIEDKSQVKDEVKDEIIV